MSDRDYTKMSDFGLLVHLASHARAVEYYSTHVEQTTHWQERFVANRKVVRTICAEVTRRVEERDVAA